MKKILLPAVLLVIVSFVINAADTRPPVVWMGDGLFGARIPAEWSFVDSEDGKSVVISVPDFESQVILVAPNFNIENANIEEYAVLCLENVADTFKVSQYDDVEFGGFGTLAVSAEAPGDGEPVQFLQAYVIDCWFGGAPAVLAFGPYAEKQAFMSAIEPLLDSVRIDFWEVWEREDELQAWSNQIIAMPPDDEADEGEWVDDESDGEAEGDGDGGKERQSRQKKPPSQNLKESGASRPNQDKDKPGFNTERTGGSRR